MACAFTFSKTLNSKVSFDEISTNVYFVCYYDSSWCAGMVQNVNLDAKDVEMKFLHPPGPSNELYLTKKKRFLLGTIYESDV